MCLKWHRTTVFNYVASAGDVLRFASLGTTEQGDSSAQFRVNYLKPSGAIGFYHRDWVVVQTEGKKEMNWIIETKGRVWEGTEAKDESIRDWCQRVSERTGQTRKYSRINAFGVQRDKLIPRKANSA